MQSILPKSSISLISTLLTLLGIYVFTSGFFLTKLSLVHTSQCSLSAASTLLGETLGLTPDELVYLRSKNLITSDKSDDENLDGVSRADGCWQPRLAQRVVIIVIDALRFDFAREHLPLTSGAYSPSYTSPCLHKSSAQSSVKSYIETETIAKTKGKTSLLKFKADPPTVTMQRIKGLTTGGLPTFADVGSSFSAVEVNEDNFLEQLKTSPTSLRVGGSGSLGVGSAGASGRSTFVGDDTWTSLYPSQFTLSHPYPSFNTRDIDSVDNGVLLHLDEMLSDEKAELVVAHFLGVDHVGHTFGPDSTQMEVKLKQMDLVLLDTFKQVDSESTDGCTVLFVFGDHGMTSSGNHGGGTSDETGAALLSHFSPSCELPEEDDMVDGDEISNVNRNAGANTATTTTNAASNGGGENEFKEVNQVDLVPTISALLGLPMPFGNVGSVIVGLLPLHSSTSSSLSSKENSKSTSFAQQASTTLALNSAQVWKYLSTYSLAAGLPRGKMKDLEDVLADAVRKYKDAVNHDIHVNSNTMPVQKGEGEGEAHASDSLAYRESLTLFKRFLNDATSLGREVWTTFNLGYMYTGIVLVAFGLIQIPPFIRGVTRFKGGKGMSDVEVVLLLFTIIVNVVHTFVIVMSDCYIRNEMKFCGVCVTCLCLLLAYQSLRLDENRSDVGNKSTTTNNRLNTIKPILTTLLIPLCTRIHETLINGHGTDVGLAKYTAMHPVIFMPALVVLMGIRWVLVDTKIITENRVYLTYTLDVTSLVSTGISWLSTIYGYSEHGRSCALVSFLMQLVSLLVGFWHGCGSGGNSGGSGKVLCWQLLVVVMIFTGPSCACSVVLVLIQMYALTQLNATSTPSTTTNTDNSDKTNSNPPILIHPLVSGTLIHLLTRHSFHATSHACTFSNLHYTSAFIVSSEFNWYVSGAALGWNTFGWEVVWLVFVRVWFNSRGVEDEPSGTEDGTGNGLTWQYYKYISRLECMGACICVFVMKRHLMIFAVFAPRYTFAIIFHILICVTDISCQSFANVPVLFEKIRREVGLLRYGKDEGKRV